MRARSRIMSESRASKAAQRSSTGERRLRVTENPRTEPGFTLLEVLLVVVILSVVAATALPRFSGAFAGVSWDRQRDSIGRFITHAHQLARLKGRPLILECDHEGTCLTLYRTFEWAARSDAILESGIWAPGPTGSEFMEFLTATDPTVGAAFAGARGPRDGSLPWWAEARIAKLNLRNGFQLQGRGFPLTIAADAISADATLRLVGPGGRFAEYDIDLATGAFGWRP